MNPKFRTALVTGASSGIGESIALRLAAMGLTVYAAARRTEKMEHLKARGIKVVHLDITDEASIRTCMKQVDPIDILINNAGYGAYGAVEEVPLEEARRQFEVNVFGLARLTQLVLPHMRRQRAGRIINISSVAGQRAIPYGGWYHATKFALEGLSASLRQELSPFNIQVVLIRPGAIKSEWSGIAAQSALQTSGKGPYAKAVQALYSFFTNPRFTDMAGNPEVISNAVEKALRSTCPRSAYTAPRSAHLMLIILKLLGTDCLRDVLIRKALKLPKTL